MRNLKKARESGTGTAPLITKAEARRRASRHFLKRLFKNAKVEDGAEVKLKVFFRGNWTAQDVWVVYMNSDETAFKSSEVVLVCKRTGGVIYEGSANDEG